MISPEGSLSGREAEKCRIHWFDRQLEPGVDRIEVYFQTVKVIDHQFTHLFNLWLMRMQARSVSVTIRGAIRPVAELLKLCQSQQWAVFE